MSSRRRALAFSAGALACAVLAAAAAGSGSPETNGLGDLRSVLVAGAPLERGTKLGARRPREALAVRRVPGAVAPPDALSSPEQAVGRRLAVSLPAGSYVTESALSAATARGRAPGAPPAGTTPVELRVTGAAALSDPARRRVRVDVVVSGSSGPGPAAGRTYVAVEGAQLLGLSRARPEPGLGEEWIATLALRRAEALRLIRAESAGRSLRLLAR